MAPRWPKQLPRDPKSAPIDFPRQHQEANVVNFIRVVDVFWRSQILGSPTLQEGLRGSEDRSKTAKEASKNTRVTSPWLASRGLQVCRTAEGDSTTSPEGRKEHLRRPKRPPRRPKSAPRRPRWPQDGPRSSQEAPRALPEASRNSPKRPKSLILFRF